MGRFRTRFVAAGAGWFLGRVRSFGDVFEPEVDSDRTTGPIWQRMLASSLATGTAHS